MSSPARVLGALRALLRDAEQRGLLRHTKEEKQHVCSPGCPKLESASYRDVIYCVRTGNIHFCGAQCLYKYTSNGVQTCGVTGRVLDVDKVLTTATPETPGERVMHFERPAVYSKIAVAEETHYEHVCAKIEQKRHELRERLFTPRPDSGRDLFLCEQYRDMIEKTLVSKPAAASGELQQIRSELDAVSKDQAELQTLKSTGGRISSLLSRGGHGKSSSAVLSGRVYQMIKQLRDKHDRKLQRRRFFRRSRPVSGQGSSETATQKLLRYVTRPVAPSQQDKVYGPYALNTRRVQRRATVGYLKELANVRADAGIFVEKLVGLSADHFRQKKSNIDCKPSKADVEYAVDRCAELWMAMVRTKLFAKELANVPQTHVFLYVVFKCLRNGCDYRGIYSCQRNDFFATRFMDVNDLSSRGVTLEKNVEFRAKTFTKISSHISIALKEAAQMESPEPAEDQAARAAAVADSFSPIESRKKAIFELMSSICREK
jgi:hypothetical protein